jgi:GTP-binding protein HflX
VNPQPRVLQDWIERSSGVLAPRVFVSALRGSGLELLRGLIARAASGKPWTPVESTPLAADSARVLFAGQLAQPTGTA